MQTLLRPPARTATPAAPSLPHLRRVNHPPPSPPNSLSLPYTKPSSDHPLRTAGSKLTFITKGSSYPVASSTIEDDPSSKLSQVAKRLENTSRYFEKLGSIGFWGQLICTLVAAVILSFSILVTGKVTSPVTFFATAGGIAAAFISVFWSFGYIRLSEKLRKTANDPSKAPPRASVVQGLQNGIVMNLLGMGAAILGMQATVGVLVAKSLTTSTNPFSQGIAPGSSPVLALDVFLVQALANTILSHFLGLVCSLELLRTVTLPASESSTPSPLLKFAEITTL